MIEIDYAQIVNGCGLSRSHYKIMYTQEGYCLMDVRRVKYKDESQCVWTEEESSIGVLEEHWVVDILKYINTVLFDYIEQDFKTIEDALRYCVPGAGIWIEKEYYDSTTDR